MKLTANDRKIIKESLEQCICIAQNISYEYSQLNRADKVLEYKEKSNEMFHVLEKINHDYSLQLEM